MQEVWRIAKAEGYRTRKNHEDGQKNWQPLKAQYAKDETILTLNPKIFEVIKRDLRIGADEVDYTDCEIATQLITLENVVESAHFIVQHLRIPMMCKNGQIPMVKFAQIAYNAGQYEAEKEMNGYLQMANEYYDMMELADPKTFVM